MLTYSCIHKSSDWCNNWILSHEVGHWMWNSSLADKHKMERFLRPDAPTVVSVYAPITFPPAGVLLFKQRNDGGLKTFCLCLKISRFVNGLASLICSCFTVITQLFWLCIWVCVCSCIFLGVQDLVATGSLLSCDPQRVVLKRIVLSGHPFKINRRSAVVRYMFFNRGKRILFCPKSPQLFSIVMYFFFLSLSDDILWFKPVELRTKWGCRGHIKEALGEAKFENQTCTGTWNN